MADLASYAPARIALAGLGRTLIGAIPLAIAVLLAVVTSRMPAVPKSAADPPPWLFAAIGLFFLLVGVLIFSGGIGRICCAFARNCHLRAGPQGMALRFPELGWLGRFRVREYSIPWRDVTRLVHFTYRISGIPTSRELRIQLRNGKTIKIPRYFFSQPIELVEHRLREIMAQAAR
jgi:hypothetical protein